jgi:hypothetical protein
MTDETKKPEPLNLRAFTTGQLKLLADQVYTADQRIGSTMSPLSGVLYPISSTVKLLADMIQSEESMRLLQRRGPMAECMRQHGRMLDLQEGVNNGRFTGAYTGNQDKAEQDILRLAPKQFPNDGTGQGQARPIDAIARYFSMVSGRVFNPLNSLFDPEKLPLQTYQAYRDQLHDRDKSFFSQYNTSSQYTSTCLKTYLVIKERNSSVVKVEYEFRSDSSSIQTQIDLYDALEDTTYRGDSTYVQHDELRHYLSHQAEKYGWTLEAYQAQCWDEATWVSQYQQFFSANPMPVISKELAYYIEQRAYRSYGDPGSGLKYSHNDEGELIGWEFNYKEGSSTCWTVRYDLNGLPQVWTIPESAYGNNVQLGPEQIQYQAHSLPVIFDRFKKLHLDYLNTVRMHAESFERNRGDDDD